MLVQSLRDPDSLGLEWRTANNFRGKVVLQESRRLVANANIAPHQSAQVIIQRAWHQVCGIFLSLLGDQIFGSVHSAFSGLLLYLRSDSGFGFEKCEDLVSKMFRQQAAKYPSVPSGGPWCVSFEVSKFMDTCHTPRSHSDAKFLQERTRHLINRLLNFCKRRTGFNKNT